MSHTPQATSRPQLPHHRHPSQDNIPSNSTVATTSETASQADRLIPLNPRAPASTPSTAVSQNEEERRCWICFVTDAEEDPPSDDWKSPCKCSLVAHETCLLDWITDMQNNGKGTRNKLACPQCNTPIRLKQDRSLVVELLDDFEKMAGRAGAFIAFGGVGSLIFTGCAVYGVNTVYTLCGTEYANEILFDSDNEFSWNWRLGAGLPLIPCALIASRTSAFDPLMIILPVSFFAHGHDPLHLLEFPPSPSVTLSILPYLRSAYCTLWNRYIKPYEQKWVKEVTPAFVLENAEQQRQQGAENDNNRRRPQRRGVQAPANANANDEDLQEQWDGEIVVENHQMIVQGTNVTSMIIGSLLWPTVAKMVGNNILGRWPASLGGDRIRRLLPTPLLRNIVGGLLFIVMKDFTLLYYKYKKAKQFSTRKVMNYSETKTKLGSSKQRRR